MRKLFMLLAVMIFLVVGGCGNGGDGGSSTTAPPPPVVEAYFDANPTNGPAPLQVLFNESSTGDIDSWLWDFGDGETSTERNPTHIYNQKNKYTVSLTVTGPDDSDTLEKVDYITVEDPLIEAYFSANPTNGPAPLEVLFNESSTGNIDSWLWDFGDGQTSTERNPTHVYEFVGHQQNKYTVSLTVTGPDGSNTMERVDYIITNDPGYGYFNPDNAVDLAVKIYMNGEEPFDVMDVPIKNAPIFFRYGIALRNLIKQIIEISVEGEQGTLYDNFGGRVDYNNYMGIDLYMEAYNYYCEDENVNIPGSLPYDHILVYNYDSYDNWGANLGIDVNVVGGTLIKLYKETLTIKVHDLWSPTSISLENGVYNHVEITDQYVQWNLYGGPFEVRVNGDKEKFGIGYDEEDAAFFVIYNGNAFPSQGCFVLEHKYPVSGGVPLGKDSSLKFLIVSASSFQVFVDTYSDGISDWDSGLLNWSDYYSE